MYYSQKSYPKVKLGTCADSIAQSGCFLTSFCSLLGILQVADISPEDFNKKAFPNGGCLANAQFWADLYRLTYRKTAEAPKQVCIAETDHYKPKGVPQHFFVWSPEGSIIDPLDVKPAWKKNPYRIVSYRIFNTTLNSTATVPITIQSSTMNKDFVQAVSYLTGKDYGDNLNDSEQKDAAERLSDVAKQLKRYKEDLKDSDGVLSSALQDNSRLKRELSDAQEAVKSSVDMQNKLTEDLRATKESLASCEALGGSEEASAGTLLKQLVKVIFKWGNSK